MDINLSKHGLLATFSSLINWKTSPYKYTKIGIITSHLKILILRCSAVKFINLESLNLGSVNSILYGNAYMASKMTTGVQTHL